MEAILNECGVDVVSETTTNFLCLCPFHGNKHTPSFSISKESGGYMCFNPSCEETGNIMELIKATTGKNPFQALRLVSKAKSQKVPVLDRVNKYLVNEPFKEFNKDVMARMEEQFWKDPRPQEYMRGRGFTNETLRHFGIGYSFKNDLISVPMHSIDGKLLGVIGRRPSADDKTFKNSKGLPTSRTFYNIHRAKRAGDTVIVVEASFDAMLVHQAGYPCVVACLGGNFSPLHQEQLARHFRSVIIMTDFDDKDKHKYKDCKKCKKAGFDTCQGHNPGRALGEKIASEMRGKVVKWASVGNEVVYGPGLKDAGDLGTEGIKKAVKNAVSNYTYHTWGIEPA